MKKFRISYRYDGSFMQDTVHGADEFDAWQQFLAGKMEPSKFRFISSVEIES